MQQHEAAEGEIHRLGQGQLLGSLGEGYHLRLRCLRGGCCHLVSSGGIRVDRVDPPVPADYPGQGDSDVTASGADVGTPPPLT